MTKYSSEKDLYSLARLLARQFTVDKYKSFLIEHELIGSHILEEPFGRFSKILVKEEYIRETLFYLWPDEKFYELIELLQAEGKLSKPVESESGSKSTAGETGIRITKNSNEMRKSELTSDRKLRVFLCHASQDKSIVRGLYQRLLVEDWIDPWLDEEKLLPGQDWDMEIEKAVEASDSVIVCLSNNSVTKEGYLQKELRKVLSMADDKPEGTIFIIPLRLDDCQPPRSLAKWQYVDYFPLKQSEVAYQRLLQALKVRSDKSPAILKQSDLPKKEIEVRKIIVSQNRYDHHTALVSEQISQASANGVRFVVGKLQWGKNDFGYSLHAEPSSYTTYGMQTTDFLDYLGFTRESCQFVSRRVCYTTWVDSEFDLPNFAKNFGDAFGLFEKATRLLESCGHFLDQPEGWEYFYPNAKRRAPRSKTGYGGDGHNANRVEVMKQTEDDDFFYRLSWIEKANTKGLVLHYRLKNPSDEELLSVVKLLDLNTFRECPLFEFEQCFWMFIEYQTRGDDIFEGNAAFAHRCYDSHAKNFSAAARMLAEANNLMSAFGFHFLNS